MAALLVLLMTGVALATDAPVLIEDHGVFGTLFEIGEEDMLALIRSHLHHAHQTGHLAALENKIKNDLAQKARTPNGPTLPHFKGDTPHVFFVDPSLTIDADIKDHTGRVLVAKGTSVNPLDHHTLRKGLLFIDGTDEAQVAHAVAHQDQFHIVLTQGNPFSLSDTHQAKFYVDQNGLITQKYRITHVPARLEQEGSRLKVTLFSVEETRP